MMDKAISTFFAVMAFFGITVAVIGVLYLVAAPSAFTLDDKCTWTCRGVQSYPNHYDERSRVCSCGDGSVYSIYSGAVRIRAPRPRGEASR